MKKVRFLYIKEVGLNADAIEMLDCFDLDKGSIYGEPVRMYAWTSSKSALKEFKRVRNMDKFIVKSIKMDNDEYEKFKKAKWSTELRIHVYSGMRNSVRLATTDLEEDLIMSAQEWLSDDLIDMELDEDVIYIIYDILKDKHKKSFVNANMLEIADIAKSNKIMDPMNYDLNVINYVLTTFRFTFI